MQVTARVVASAPGRQALAQLRGERPAASERFLYVVRTPRPERDADRPRRVISIEYLAN